MCIIWSISYIVPEGRIDPPKAGRGSCVATEMLEVTKNRLRFCVTTTSLFVFSRARIFIKIRVDYTIKSKRPYLHYATPYKLDLGLKRELSLRAFQ